MGSEMCIRDRGKGNLIAKTVWFPLLIAGCFLIGWMIPIFYYWTGSGQNRLAPEFQEGYWSLLGFGTLSWFVIPWLPMRKPAAGEETKAFQFDIRLLLLITSIVAVVTAAGSKGPIALSVLLGVTAFVALARMVAKELSWKFQIGALLACMYLPYVWFFFTGSFRSIGWSTIVGYAIGLPAFLPSFFLAGLFGTHVDEAIWLMILLLVVEVAIGFWVIRIGPRCAVVYFVFAILMSILGSMILDVLMRM